MSVSITFLLILFALNVCFVANHCILRRLRFCTDKRAESGEENVSRPPFGCKLLVTLTNKFNRGESDNPKFQWFRRFLERLFEWFMAFLFDFMPRTQESMKDFDNWRELPFSAGRWSTAIFIVGATLILSDELLVRYRSLRFSLLIAQEQISHNGAFHS